MMDKQKLFYSLFLSSGLGFILGISVILVFQLNPENETMSAAGISSQELVRIEQKLVNLEAAINNMPLSDSQAQNNESISTAQLQNVSVDKLSQAISRQVSIEIENDKIQQQNIQAQEEIARDFEQAENEAQLVQSVFDAIHPSSPDRMSNIKDVMQSEQMHSMSSAGRERVVAQLVQMANNGELDIGTFFGTVP